MFWGPLKAKICAGSEEEQITKHIQKCYPLTTPRQRKKTCKKIKHHPRRVCWTLDMPV